MTQVNTTDQMLEQIQKTIEERQPAIELMERFGRLRDNPDFRAIIEDDYFVTNASRLVLLKSDPSMASEADQEALDRSIIAVGEFQQYLRGIVIQGNQATKDISAAEEAREEIERTGSFDEK